MLFASLYFEIQIMLDLDNFFVLGDLLNSKNIHCHLFWKKDLANERPLQEKLSHQ